MNHLQQLERVIANANQPGHFRRDSKGNEHDIQAYLVRFSHQVFARRQIGAVEMGEKEHFTRYQTAVVIAPSSMTAKLVAIRPYKDASIISCESHHLNNATALRLTFDSEDEQAQAHKA